MEQIIICIVLAFAAFWLGVWRGRRQEGKSQSLVTNERHFQQIIEAAPVGICIVRERRFAFVNDAYVEMFGYSTNDEILGRFVEELYAERERVRQRSYARDRVAGKPVPTIYETVGLRKDGKEFEVSAWVSLVRYQGQLSSLGFVIDRSVEKEMRGRLEQSNRMEAVGTLAGGIAHDFNNILTAIIGFSELALVHSKDNELVANDLKQVLQAGKRAKELVRQIVLFSRRQEQLMRAVELSPVVDEVVRLVRATLPANITLHTELQSDVSIQGDSTRIHQLVMNLCANAEHAMRKTGGALNITVSRFIAEKGAEKTYPGLIPGEYGLLRIADSGDGIPAEIRERIFEPFFTTKGVGEGTGMGLAQVHGIVSSHRGYVSLVDNVPHGTVFSVFFPVSRQKETAWLEGVGQQRVGSGRILLVDDEVMVLEVIERTLCVLGYDVVACSAAGEALALFLQEPARFDLVISDMTMPDMTGDRLARAIKGVNPDMPIVLCSGYSAVIEESPELCSMVTLLEKPVEKSLLAETVHQLLHEKDSLTSAAS